MSEVRWPEVVPILEPGEIFKGEFDGPGDTHCLLGWCRKVFPDSFDYGFSMEHEAFVALKREVRSRAKTETQSNFICVFNDESSPAELAATWNATMRKLGYTVPCDR